MLPLPGYDREGRKVILGCWGVYDPTQVSADDMFKVGCLITDIMLEEDEQTSVTGVVFVSDCTGLTLSHAVTYPPAMAKKSLVLW